MLALYGLGILSEKAIRGEELAARLRSLERENESLKRKNKEVAAENSDLKKKNMEVAAENGDLKKKNKEVVAENGELRKKNSELGSELASIRAAHLDQIGVINSKVQQLGKEKDAVKRMLDQVADDLRREKDRSSTAISSLKDEVAALKSGAVLTDESYSVACKKLFESPEWDEAQLEIMITAGRLMRSEILEHHPGLDLGFLSDRLDVPTPSEQRAQGGETVTSPPILTPVAEEAGQEVAEGQEGEVVTEGHPPEVAPAAEAVAVVEVAREPTTVPERASSEGIIFGDCGPIGEL